MMRFQRQIVLPELGERGQEILRSSSVLVVGAGGLGHPAIQYLVGMGVGRLGVVDGDVVSESNLHRQVLFEWNDVGKAKARVIKEKYQVRGDPTEVEAYDRFLTRDLALELFSRFDVIIDGTDNFPSKFLINDVCVHLDKPFVYGAISGFEGQLAVFWRNQGPCYRCLVSEMPRSPVASCVETGVVGALPGIIGSMQALEALKLILYMKGHQSRLTFLLGRIQVFDFAANTAFTLDLPKRPGCRCQLGKTSFEEIEDAPALACGATSPGLLVDVREDDEWREFHTPGAFHWPLSRLLQGEMPEELRAERITTICKSGGRARQGAEILRANGYEATFTSESVYGYQTWKKESTAAG